MIVVYLTSILLLPIQADASETTQANVNPTPAEVVVNTGTGIASHALSSKGFSGIQAHYLQEYHTTTIHLIYRPPNVNEVQHGIQWANTSCPTQKARATKIEEYETDIIKELFGENITNVKNLPQNLSPNFPGRYPNLIVNPNMRGSKSLYGLPLTPKEAQSR